MKKLFALLVLFTVYSLQSTAQLLVQVIDVATGQTKYISYLPSTNKNYIDSSVNTRALFNHQHYATSIIGDALHRFVTDAQIAQWNTTTSTSGALHFSGNGNFVEVLPANYNPVLFQGKFTSATQEFPLVNPDPRSNVVGSFWGYNTNPGGGQTIQGEASYRFAGETYYHGMMEFHLPDLFTNTGMNVRPLSLYFDRASGTVATNMQIKQMNFKKTENANTDWLTIINDHNNIRINMTPEVGGSSYFQMDGKVFLGTQFNSRFYITKEINTVNFVNDIGGTGAFVFNQAISTGAAEWKFGAVINGNPTIIINGVTYKLAVVQ